MSAAHPHAERRPWLNALPYALPIVALVAFLYVRWFAVLDRYFIFLYYHDMGAGHDTSPFGAVTASRYWMSGLVAAGAVMVLYLIANAILGRIKGYHAPEWWRVWLLSAGPLLIAVPAIVMTVNDPVLPLLHAARIAAALTVGLALAVLPGRSVAERPGVALLLVGDGLGVAVLIAALRGVEYLLGQGARQELALAFLRVGLIAALIAFAVGTAIYAWRRRTPIPGVGALLVAGADVHYLFLPLIHHVLFSTDEGTSLGPGTFRYISDAANYFPARLWMQIAIWLVVAALAWGVTRLRQAIRARQGVAVAAA